MALDKTCISHQGEIVLKEKNVSGTKERYFVKPPVQSSLVVTDVGNVLDAYSWFSKLFLPHGYPNSVSKDYTAYQTWDTAQAFCSTITGTLATQEVLRGVGVGDTAASPLAATITWVIKDSCGHVGRILFACTHGTELDASSKKWRLYADVLNDAAMCMEISLPIFKEYTMFVLCISTAMKAIVGVAGGATRAALTQHHAVTGNLADVSAKDSAQETAVNLLASLTALMLISIFGNSVYLFFLLMILHITFNYLAVRSVCLRSLNEPRFLQLITAYIQLETVPSPCDVNRHEPIVYYHWGHGLLDLRLCGFRIKMGNSLKKVVKANPRLDFLNKIIEIYKGRGYLIYPDIGNRVTYVMLRDDSRNDDVMCAYFHAVLLSIIICAINSEPLKVYETMSDTRPFARVCHILQAANWSREPTFTVGRSGFVYDPSPDLMVFLNKIVHKEWRRFKIGLRKMNWDLSKNLLLTEDWRVSNHTIDPDGICVTETDDKKEEIIKYANEFDFVDVNDEDMQAEKTPSDETMDDTLETRLLTIEPEPQKTWSSSSLVNTTALENIQRSRSKIGNFMKASKEASLNLLKYKKSYSRGQELSDSCIAPEEKVMSREDQKTYSEQTTENKGTTTENIHLASENKYPIAENKDLIAENKDLVTENKGTTFEKNDLTTDDENVTIDGLNFDRYDPTTENRDLPTENNDPSMRTPRPSKVHYDIDTKNPEEQDTETDSSLIEKVKEEECCQSINKECCHRNTGLNLKKE